MAGLVRTRPCGGGRYADALLGEHRCTGRFGLEIFVIIKHRAFGFVETEALPRDSTI
jgi:hypothetical protein